MKTATFSRKELSCVLAALGMLSAVPGYAQTPDQIGQWQSLTDWGFYPVHNHVLPTGKVMVWSGDGDVVGNNPQLWDPATQTLTSLGLIGYNAFCSGHAFLADGRLFVAGGHNGTNASANGDGVPYASLYDPFSNSWASAPDMNAGRWYPTVTTLSNGDALVVSGTMDTSYAVDTLPQVYQAATNTWRNLSNAQLGLDLYPMMFLAPNGKVINVGPAQTTRYLDTANAGAWSVVANRNFGDRNYGSAVMFDGKVLVMGGGDPPTSTAELIELNAASPTWQFVASMSVARRQLNSTLLPDGTVLVTGGTSGAGFNDPTNAIFTAELWDPANPGNGWKTLAATSTGYPRIYHSAAALLPDGRVLITGGNDQTVQELYSPPYLFKGTRPTISSAPSVINYAQSFSVQSPDAGAISKVTLIRLSSVTHAFNENQRLNTLTFKPSPNKGTLAITAPSSGNSAPPGHYLLFLVNGNGVPSLGKIVQLTAGSAANQVTLTVSKSGYQAAQATVTSSPAGISCGNACAASFNSGTALTLTAQASSNNVFAGWSGACSGTSPTCTVTMNASKGVTASFRKR